MGSKRVDLEYLNAILDIAKVLPRNINNRGIFDYFRDQYDTLLVDERGELFLFNQDNTNKKPIAELGQEELLQLYAYLEANRFTMESRDTLLDKNIDEKIWHIEPTEILIDDEVVGLLGVSIEEKVEDTELRGVVFMSADGSFATLTMYDTADEDSRETAERDLQKIGEAIQNIIL